MPYYRCPACGLTSYSAARYSMLSACPNCAAGLPDAAKLNAMHMGADITRILSARAESAGLARRTVVGLPLPQATRDVLALLASELVSNCVRHAGASGSDTVSLRVSDRAGRIRLAVTDGGAGFARPAISRGDSLAPGGRGLLIVDELADDWGVDDRSNGCTVWCELVVEEEPAAADEREVTTGYLRELAQHIARPAAAPSVAI
jgi:anti-sigma regulatory factor (Ser/Thr protein kinase)